MFPRDIVCLRNVSINTLIKEMLLLMMMMMMMIIIIIIITIIIHPYDLSQQYVDIETSNKWLTNANFSPKQRVF